MGMRILVVDDDVQQLRSVKRYLNAAGLSIITCTNVAEAITALEGIPIDVVLTDIQMPEESGLSIIKWVEKKLPDVPVFAMTAFGSDEIYQDVLQHGAVVYLEKPVDLKLLVQLLATSRDSCRSANCFVTACLEAASNRGTGEVVVHNENQLGQFFYFEGKIAWAAVQKNKVTFIDELVSQSQIKRDVVSKLIQECKKNTLDFFVELVARQLISKGQLTNVVHLYISNCFAQCLQWEKPKSMYIQNSRSYHGHILFDLVDILTLANASPKPTASEMRPANRG
jgi:CheY-like chemotaxis protein